MQIALLNHYYYSAKSFLLDTEGATAIEYGLLATLLATTIIGAQTGLGNAIDAMYTGAVGIITAALGS
ncbi:MAG: Flp family type IVb pilin [Nitrospirota bacterium]|mgnify:FL=1|nr:Flp family type IVb pilin [Nitrospirota bacterium]